MGGEKKPDLEVRCDGMTYQMEEVGSWSWQKGEDGSITLTASPPGVTPPVATARQGRSRGLGSMPSGGGGADLGKKLVGALTPGLQAHAEGLRAKSKESMEAAKRRAAEKAAEEQAATPTRGAPPEDEDSEPEPDL